MVLLKGDLFGHIVQTFVAAALVLLSFPLGSILHSCTVIVYTNNYETCNN